MTLPTVPTTPSSDAAIHSHISHLIAHNLPASPIYNFLLSSVSLTHASKGHIRARLPLTANHVNSKGGLHGSVSATIIDWAGGMAVASWDLREKTGVSADIHVTYLASARVGDEIEIEGRAEKVGRSLAFTSVRIWKVEDGEASVLLVNGTHTKYVKQ